MCECLSDLCYFQNKLLQTLLKIISQFLPHNNNKFFHYQLNDLVVFLQLQYVIWVDS